MKRLAVFLIVVTLVAGVEVAARRIEPRLPAALEWDNQFTQDKAGQISDLGDQLDVLFAGSSVAQANLDPPIFIETSHQFDTAYNAGLPSATPRVWRQFLLDTVYAQLCPAVVVIAVDVRQFSDNKPGGDNQFGRYVNSAGRLEAVGTADVWQRAEEWLESRSALFRIRARLREPDKIVARVWGIGDPGYWRYTNLSPLGRYLSNDTLTYVFSQESLDKLADGAFRDFSVGGAETTALRQMIEDALERGIAPVLVETPAMNESLVAALPRGDADLAAYSNTLRAVAQEYEIPFIRMAEFDNQPVFYADLYHMNFTGVEAVTRSLAERIDELELDAGTGLCEPAS